MTDDELKAEVMRRGLVVGVQANDPHDGYYAFELDPALLTEGSVGGDAQPMVWRSDVVSWRQCAEDGCEERSTTGAYEAYVGWSFFCADHRRRRGGSITVVAP